MPASTGWPEEARAVVQSAAVIGREFSLPLLAAMHPRRPAAWPPRWPSCSGASWCARRRACPSGSIVFKHALTQETAYNSLLLKTRRELHLSVAGVLERSAPDRVNDLAYHYLAARQPARALPYLIEAADRAAKAYATPEAIGYYQPGAGDPGETGATWHGCGMCTRGWAMRSTSPTAQPRPWKPSSAMLAVADAGWRRPMQVSALNKLSFTLALRMGQFEQAEVNLAEADRRARQWQDKPGLSEMGLIRCMMCTAVADFPGVVRYMDETWRWARAGRQGAGGPVPHAHRQLADVHAAHLTRPLIPTSAVCACAARSATASTRPNCWPSRPDVLHGPRRLPRSRAGRRRG